MTETLAAGRAAGPRWRTFAWLMAAAVVATAALLPYLWALQGPTLEQVPLPRPLLLGLLMVQPLVLTAALTALGLWLGPGVGLGTPLLDAWLGGEPEAVARIRRALAPALALGAAVAVVVAVLDGTLFRAAAQTLQAGAASSPAPWQGLLASLYGGVVEELQLRLGVMTLLVWLGATLTRQARPGPATLWTANVLTAVLFGLGHLPATAALVPLTGALVLRAVVLNGLPGLLYGWLYMRHGWLAAAGAHLATDVVLHGLLVALA